MSDTQQLVAQYTWSSGTAPVSAGTFQSDSRNWSGATELYFSNADSQSQDLTNTFAALALDDTVRAEQGGNPGNWRVWRVTAAAAQEADLSWSVPVESLANGGTNVSNNQACHVVFTLALTPQQSLADWTMEPADPTHWFSVIVCPHGITRSGVWLNQPIQDDRNFEEQADPAFANHQALYPDCDCALNIVWTPSYVLPAEIEPVEAAAEDVEPQAAGSATFSIWASYPKLYGGRVTCSHGWAQSGVWQGTIGWPDLLAVQAETYRNHQRLFGCGDTLAAPDTTAVLTCNAVSVARGVIQPVPENGAVVTGTGLSWNGSRLVVQQLGVYGISARLTLSRSIAQGAAGYVHLLIQGQSFARAPSLEEGGQAVGRISWSGQLAAGFTLRLGFENSSALAYQDVLAGSTLNATSVTVLTPP